MTDRMKTGIMVYPMDDERLNKELAESELISSELKENEYPKCPSNEGIIRHGDDIYWLDKEGVMITKPISEDNPIKLDIHSRTKNGDGSQSWTMYPRWQTTLHGDDIEEYFSDEGVPLEDFVRVFGDRLEGNFWGIVRFLQSIKAIDREEEK